MLTRIITAVVALVVFVGVLLAPPIVFTVALGAVILVMLYECYKATKADMAMKVVGFISGILMLVALSFISSTNMIVADKTDISPWFTVALAYPTATIILLIYMALIVAKHGKRSYKDILSNGFLTLYVTVSMWCIHFIRDFFGTEFMLFVFISAWCCDTFAYFSGRFFGKRKLIPHVSPNKTVAGSIGGVIGSVVCCVLYVFIAKKLPINVEFTESSYILAAIIGLVGGAFSQLGDLIASSIKRDEAIKDFGWIFPGHGGFMDRFDSVMYIAPIILMTLIGTILFV